MSTAVLPPQRCRHRLPVDAEVDRSERLPRQRAGDPAGPAVLTGLLHCGRECEIWSGTSAHGAPVVVKVLADQAGAVEAATRESVVLWQLAGGPAPRLLHSDLGGDLPRGVAARLVLTRAEGVRVDEAALRLGQVGSAWRARRELVVAVAARYAELHDRGVLHGDIRAQHVLVGSDGVVTLVGFARARLRDGGLDPVPRTVTGDYLDPEAAAALQAGSEPADVSEASEQYAVAALLWQLLTDAPYLPLPPERSAALDQIRTRTPSPLEASGAPAWPTGEAALRQALSKDPRLRHRSMRTLFEQLSAAVREPGEPYVPGDRVVPEAGRMIAAFEVDQPSWRQASAAQAAQAAELLRRVAVVTGDIDAAELSAAWALRAAHSPDAPVAAVVAEARRCLQDYRRTGDRLALRRAVRLARSLPALPPDWASSLAGSLAGDLESEPGPEARLLLLVGGSDRWQQG